MDDSESLQLALEFAKAKHKGQKRIGGDDYITHPIAVSEIVKSQGFDENYQITALFHDLPESVTRDIISPVKQATRELPAIVKKIEDEIVQRELVPLMESSYVDEILYFTSDEFDNRICESNFQNVKEVSFDELNSKFNSDEFNPVDGKLVRCADHVAAFIEADSSIKHGITSVHLTEGRNNIKKIYPSGCVVNGFAIGDFFDSFDI